MIRFIRILSLIIFAAAILLYGGISYYTESRSDSIPPSITMDSPTITVSVSDPPERILSGVTASDNKDGDVTDSLVLEHMGVLIDHSSRQVTLAAFDSHNNVTKTRRTVLYSDYTSPRVTLTGSLRAPVNSLSTLMNHIRVSDCLDGDITDNVQITSNGYEINGSRAGEFEAKIIITNSVNDVVELPVTIEFYDYSSESLRPEIILTDYLIYHPMGKPINPSSYLKGIRLRSRTYIWNQLSSDDSAPISADDIRIDNPVDIHTPGVYEIVYTVEDADDNQGHVRLIVVITEN